MKTNYKTQVRRSRLQIKYYDCFVIDEKFVFEKNFPENEKYPHMRVCRLVSTLYLCGVNSNGKRIAG